MHFLNEEVAIFTVFITVFPRVQWQWVITGSGRGLAPYKQQAISWTNGDTIPGRHVALLCYKLLRGTVFRRNNKQKSTHVWYTNLKWTQISSIQKVWNFEYHAHLRSSTGVVKCYRKNMFNFVSKLLIMTSWQGDAFGTADSLWAWISHPKGQSWWRHQMEFSALLALCAGNSPVTGEFPARMPVTWSFDVFFHLRLNKRLSTVE